MAGERHGGVDCEGDRIVVRVAALVGVGQNGIGARDERCQPPHRLGQAVGRALVRHAEPVMTRRRHARQSECRPRLRPADGRVVGGAVEAVATRVLGVAGRAIGDVHEVDVRQPRQQRTAAEHLVVRMRHHDEPAQVGRRRAFAFRGGQACGSSRAGTRPQPGVTLRSNRKVPCGHRERGARRRR